MARHVIRRATLLAAVAALVSVSGGLAAGAPTGWSMGGHDLSNTRSNPDQKAITASNAGKLATKWTFTTHGDVSATPAVVGGAVYFPDWGGYINKVNANDRPLIWQRKLTDYGYNTSADLVSRTARRSSATSCTSATRVAEAPSARRPGGSWRSTPRTAICCGATIINPNFFTIITQSPVVTERRRVRRGGVGRGERGRLHPRLPVLQLPRVVQRPRCRDRADPVDDVHGPRRSGPNNSDPAIRASTRAARSGAAPRRSTPRRTRSTSRPATTTAVPDSVDDVPGQRRHARRSASTRTTTSTRSWRWT